VKNLVVAYRYINMFDCSNGAVCILSNVCVRIGGIILNSEFQLPFDNNLLYFRILVL